MFTCKPPHCLQTCRYEHGYQRTRYCSLWVSNEEENMNNFAPMHITFTYRNVLNKRKTSHHVVSQPMALGGWQLASCTAERDAQPRTLLSRSAPTYRHYLVGITFRMLFQVDKLNAHVRIYSVALHRAGHRSFPCFQLPQRRISRCPTDPVPLPPTNKKHTNVVRRLLDIPGQRCFN